MIQRLSPLFVAFSLLFHIIHTTSVTCYQLNGRPYSPQGDWLPCNPSAQTSHCCSIDDYCLDIGLCVNAEANNIFSVQGCTDPECGAPCVLNSVCLNSSSAPQTGGSNAWACGTATSDYKFHYCCGDPICCDDPNNLSTVIPSRQLYKPGNAAANNPQVVTETLSVTSTQTTTATTTQTVGAVTVTATAAGADGNNKTSIGLGAGLGAAVLALAGACLYLANRLRKTHQAVPQHDPFKSAFSPTAHNPASPPQQQPVFIAEALAAHNFFMPELHNSFVPEYETYPSPTAAR